VTIEKTQNKVTGKHITPGVIEPSFGIGRILYSILEHSYYEREQDEQRRVLSLPPAIAPVKVSVLPLLQHDNFLEYIPNISKFFFLFMFLK
jgi:glycyl-tRNA synthetase